MSWQRFADGLESDDLFQIEEELRELREHRGFKRICDLIDRGKTSTTNVLIRGGRSGAVPSQAEYARQAAYIDGLDEFRRGVDVLIGEAEKERAERRANIDDKAAEAERQAREAVPA